MAEARRPAASKKQEAGVLGFLGLLAIYVGRVAEENAPGSGEAAAAGTLWLGALLANKLRDLLL